jgi:bile acid:Na+ symporter, BASS family
MKQNTWLIITVGIIFSFIYPSFGISLKPFLNYLLMILMFLSCLDINFKEVLSDFFNFKEETLILAIVHLVSPFIVLFLKSFFSEEIFLGLIIVTTIPAARSSVFLSSIYGGNTSKSLTISTVSNALSPIIVPFLIWLFAKTNIQVDYQEMGYTILILTIIPIGLALIIRRFKMFQPLKKYNANISIFVLLFLIIGIISPIVKIIIDHPLLSFCLGILTIILNTINFNLGFFIGKNNPDKIAFAITSTYKNTTLANILALSFSNPLIALPSVIYTVINNFIIPIQVILKKKSAKIK